MKGDIKSIVDNLHLVNEIQGTNSGIQKRKHIFLFMGISHKRQKMEKEKSIYKYLIAKLLFYIEDRRFTKADNNKMKENLSNQAESRKF